MLQTINALCIASNEQDAEFSPAYQALLRRQLPAIAGRLSGTLEKLNQPKAEVQKQLTSAARWWRDFNQRVAPSPWIALEPSQTEGDLSAELFSSVVENLMRNASEKRLRDPALQLQVKLVDGDNGVELEVSDNGEPIAEDIARNLFSVPVDSKSGLGIGLYQAARHAESTGYQLELSENRPGRVCFRLAPAALRR